MTSQRAQPDWWKFTLDLPMSHDPGARFAYWNMLVPRRLSKSFPGRVRYLEAESKELFAKDLAWFYSAFVVEEVV